jgi:hypothetical protein
MKPEKGAKCPCRRLGLHRSPGVAAKPAELVLRPYAPICVFRDRKGDHGDAGTSGIIIGEYMAKMLRLYGEIE